MNCIIEADSEYWLISFRYLLFDFLWLLQASPSQKEAIERASFVVLRSYGCLKYVKYQDGNRHIIGKKMSKLLNLQEKYAAKQKPDASK